MQIRGGAYAKDQGLNPPVLQVARSRPRRRARLSIERAELGLPDYIPSALPGSPEPLRAIMDEDAFKESLIGLLVTLPDYQGGGHGVIKDIKGNVVQVVVLGDKGETIVASHMDELEAVQPPADTQ